MKGLVWYAMGVNKPAIPCDSRLKALDFVEHHPGYTDVIPVELSDLQEVKRVKRETICVL